MLSARSTRRILLSAAHKAFMNTTLGTIEAMTASPQLITAPQAAALVRDALSAGNSDLAIRQLTEAIARLIESKGKNIPADEFAEPETTGDANYDAVLAAAFLYAANICQLEAPGWTELAPLTELWLWGGDGFESEQYKSLIRSQTPSEFLERNILTRPRDWVNA
ncbi:hypothetical protein FB472_2308 [Rhodoglobus vestalii]|uniref:Uncharacterized protein n=2 Tax=Rhodoglobus vestalii TaxID=193384 RepID=A0A8H2PYU0_9MICO|nr:hypothetical protein FB472_2308 [Rhodoglobus vestalii]